MGYTHYFEMSEVSQKKWNEFIKDVKYLYKRLPRHSKSSGAYHENDPLIIGGGWDNRKPIFNENQILFNGYATPNKDRKGDKNGKFPDDELSNETFHLINNDEDKFCKTARKPYDMLVQCVLILAKYHFKNKITITSDGNFKDWEYSIDFVEKMFPKISMKKSWEIVL